MGTTFLLTLPSSVPAFRPRLVRVEARVLVVDDERSMRDLLAIMLRKNDYDVTTAEGGRRRWGRRANGFDLVITDLRMRKVDGLAVLRAAKELSPQTVAWSSPLRPPRPPWKR